MSHESDTKGGNTIDILKIIEELDSISGSATRVPGLRRRVIVDHDRLVKAGEQLRASIPSDIQEAREILKQQEGIINQSHLEARRIKESAAQESLALTNAAKEEQKSRVDETEIVKAAEVKAHEINQHALQEAEQIVQDAQRRAYRIAEEVEAVVESRREGANQYARETLFDLEERLASLLSQVRKGIDALGLEVEVKIPS